MVFTALAIAVAGVTADTRLIKLDPVPFTQVTISDQFWSPRRDKNRKVSLPHSLDSLGKAGNIKDFELAAEGAHTGYMGPVFMDSDLYKTLEAISYSLATDPDPVLEKKVDAIIAKIAAAQREDGYLDTYYEVNEPDKRFTNLAWNHELYCAGHLFEAAVAHYEATGKKTLLNIATRYADLLCKTFGNGPGQRMGYPGHPEIELALVKLWKATGNQDYFRLAKFFIDSRGSGFFAKEENKTYVPEEWTYNQDNLPIRQQTQIVGHAVRAGYLMSGVVDVARESNDEGLLTMVNRVWKDTVTKKMFVTGGIGPSASNEGFTVDYDLPNLTAYQETCASVAMAMWNYRLALLYGDGKYADVMERVLYNGVLAGYSLDGTKYFYVNPLASGGGHHRQGWFSCACCPPNEARTLAQLGGYAYATSPDALWVNLFIQGSVKCQIGQAPVKMDVKTAYPWDGNVSMTLHPAKSTPFGLMLRIPGWCSDYSVSVNGHKSSAPKQENGYVGINGTWKEGDQVTLSLKMDVRPIQANPQVSDDLGKIAYMRGPLVYCAEQVDAKAPLGSIAVPYGASFKVTREPQLLGGVVTLTTQGLSADNQRWPGGLYSEAVQPDRTDIKLIPYYAWDNREAGPMEVWIPTSPASPVISGLEREAKVEMSFVNWNSQPKGANDGHEPKSSGEQPAQCAHWWDHKGTQEWIQYEWPKAVTTDRVQVYWFDDTGRGECRIPQSWKLEFDDKGTWRTIDADYPVKIDSWCDVRFKPIATTRLRLTVQMQKGWASGVQQWRVWPVEE